MKIDSNTISLLKNFAKINPSIIIDPGNEVRTMSTLKTIMAKANVSTTFERGFAIYNLDRFISTLSLFQDPDLEFNETYVTISEGRRSIKYVYADRSVIKSPPAKDIVIPSIDAQFTLTNENFKSVERAAGVLELPEISIRGDGNTIWLQAEDTNNPSGDIYSIDVGETDKEFKAIFKIENLKIIPDEYNVNICSKGISHFKSDTVEYWIVVEAHSTF